MANRGWTLAVVFGLFASIALADDESDRRGYLGEIDAKLGAAASELAGAKSDTDDGDLRDADGYVDQVRDLVSRLEAVKGDDSRAREVVDRYPAYIEKFKRANAALRSMKGYQFANVTIMKTCHDKNVELVGIARDFEHRGDAEGLEKIPRIAADFKNMTVRFLEEAEKFRAQLEDWKRIVQYFDVSDGRWSDVRAVLHREADEMYSYYKSDHDNAKERCKDLSAGPDHPVVKDVLGKLASSAAGRKEVMENLHQLADELAGKIKAVPGASGTYAVDGVREKLDAIDSTLAILERTKAADPKAKEIADRWPAIAREARAAIEPLRELKEHHHALDELPRRCQDLESQLDAFIALNGDDADGLEKIPAFATDLGNPVIVGIARVKDRLEKMKTAREGAQRFTRSDVGWSSVSAAYRATATTIFELFEDRYEETEVACREIVTTRDHPKVLRAVERLRAMTGSASERLSRRVSELRTRWSAAQAMYRAFEKDFWALQDDSKRLRKFDVDELDQLIVFTCGQDHERNGDEADRLSGEMRTKVVSAARSRRDDYLKASDDLEVRLPSMYRELQVLNDEIDAVVVELETVKKIDKSVVQSVRELSAEVAGLREAKRATFFALQKGDRQSFLNTSDDLLNGENNPRTAASSKHGRLKHVELQKDSKFACAESEYPAGGGFADCVSHAQCVVWEFKPDSYDMDDALEQGARYLDDVKRTFSKDSSSGRLWEHCWKPDGPSQGKGYEVRGFLYPKCTPGR